MADIEFDFHCWKCGAKTNIAPPPPAKVVCEDCCEDHDYKYESGICEHRCVHCDKSPPDDWYEVD